MNNCGKTARVKVSFSKQSRVDMFVPISVDPFFDDGVRMLLPQGNVWILFLIFVACYLEAFIANIEHDEERE